MAVWMTRMAHSSHHLAYLYPCCFVLLSGHEIDLPELIQDCKHEYAMVHRPSCGHKYSNISLCCLCDSYDLIDLPCKQNDQWNDEIKVLASMKTENGCSL